MKENRVRRAVCMVLTAAMLALSVLSAAGCADKGENGTASGTKTEISMTDIAAEINSRKTADFEESDSATEYVRITVTNHGDIVLRLRADIAPVTVQNFQKLVSEKFYDGLTFHRVIPNFMIQGGDPNGDGTGSTTAIKGEMTNNGFANNLTHIRGVLSMARRGGNYDSGSCQFFICNADASHLNGEYASFGYVVAGMETVDSISAVATSASNNKPVENVVMEKVCFVRLK